MSTQKLTGLHAQLFPSLVDVGFKVFSEKRIKLLISLIDTGSLTKPGTYKPTKKALEILPLCLNFGSTHDHDSIFGMFRSFHIYIRNNQVVAEWSNSAGLKTDFLPLFKAVQKFEVLYRPIIIDTIAKR